MAMLMLQTPLQFGPVSSELFSTGSINFIPGIPMVFPGLPKTFESSSKCKPPRSGIFAYFLSLAQQAQQPYAHQIPRAWDYDQRSQWDILITLVVHVWHPTTKQRS
jgi:hypothetical protein